MDVCSEKESDHGGAAEDDKIDDNLEGILALSPVCKGRHAAAEYQTREEH